MHVLVSSDRTAATTAGCMALATAADQLLRPAPPTAHGSSASRPSAVTETGASRPRSTTPRRPLQIVERRTDGIVIAGGKQHVVGAPVVHELLLVPSGRGGDDAAVACAVPVNSPGVRLIASTTAPRAEDDRHHPVSRGH